MNATRRDGIVLWALWLIVWVPRTSSNLLTRHFAPRGVNLPGSIAVTPGASPLTDGP